MKAECGAMLGGVQLELLSNGKHQRKGIRPYRNSVRVEVAEAINGVPVCVNYGHGGSGVTLAWGCASDAIAAMENATGQSSVAEAN